jgi:hypothetical protein
MTEMAESASGKHDLRTLGGACQEKNRDGLDDPRLESDKNFLLSWTSLQALSLKYLDPDSGAVK